MPCCGGKTVVVTTAPGSGLVLASPDKWLPFPANQKPPGGWGSAKLGITADTPTQAADRLAGKQLAEGTFDTLKEVYSLLVADYCGRPGSACGNLGK